MRHQFSQAVLTSTTISAPILRPVQLATNAPPPPVATTPPVYVPDMSHANDPLPDGVLAWDGREFHRRPAYRVPVVDTTGAGDIFHAGFIYALLQGWPLDRQLDFSCAAAAMNCMGAGARGGIQSVAAVEELMATTPRYLSVCDVPAAD